jgi:DNA-binding MarR family transcriptional regulator
VSRTSVTRELAVVLHDLSRVFRDRGPAEAGLEPLPPTDLAVMRCIAHHRGSRVSDVADALGLAPNNVSTSVRSLTARGLVVREPDPHDRRAVRLHPTEKALADRAAIEAAWGRRVETAFAGLGDDQRQALRAALGALQALSEELADARREEARPQ